MRRSSWVINLRDLHIAEMSREVKGTVYKPSERGPRSEFVDRNTAPYVQRVSPDYIPDPHVHTVTTFAQRLGVPLQNKLLVTRETAVDYPKTFGQGRTSVSLGSCVVCNAYLVLYLLENAIGRDQECISVPG